MQSLRVCLAALVLISLAACGEADKPSVSNIGAATPETKPLADKNQAVRVALVMKTLTNPFFLEMEKGAHRAEKEAGITLKVDAATQEANVEQQTKIVEDQIAAKVAAIVIAPGDSMRMVAVLKKAQDAGIKVVNIDNRLNQEAMKAAGMAPVPFISVANDAAAYLSAKFVADKLTQPTEAAIIEGIRAADNANQRKLGAEKAFKENAKLKIVAMETANWKIDEAYEVAKSMFKAHPKIGVIFCANDMMALGVIKFLQESGRKDVLVAGFDAMDDAKAAIRKGEMAVTIDQQAAEQGYRGVMTALALLRGEPVPEVVEVSASVVSADSLK